MLDAHQTAQIIDQVFKKLGTETKELLLQKYIDKRQVKDIAAQAGRTPKAIESDLFRARRDFRHYYLEMTENS